MGYMKCLLILPIVFVVSYSLEAPMNCGSLMDPLTEFQNVSVDQRGNLLRFCQELAYEIRREHFWCGGYLDENGTVVPDSTLFSLPEDTEDPEDSPFWTIYLQYPALSWMDVARKGRIMEIIRDVALYDTADCPTLPSLDQFCVSNVETFDVSEYSESVSITMYNFGILGADFDQCFKDGLRSEDVNNVLTRFRGRRAFRLSLEEMNLDLTDMFSQNIGPASSIGNENRDPTLRPVYIGSWPGALSRRQVQSRVSDSDFASNPDPINYGLEAGDIVFAVFGSILLVILSFLILLGFCIHPFFLS